MTMTLRFLVACALATTATVIGPWTAAAAPSSPEPGCPVTDPPVINRCGWETTPAPPPPPPTQQVYMCQDGAIVFTEQPSYRKTCSENGGVAEWLAG